MKLPLSPRQVFILQALVCGSTVKSIAQTLHISPSMIRKHIYNAKNRMGARTRDHAIALAVARGYVSVILDFPLNPPGKVP